MKNEIIPSVLNLQISSGDEEGDVDQLTLGISVWEKISFLK